MQCPLLKNIWKLKLRCTFCERRYSIENSVRSKQRPIYICSACGHRNDTWLGQCPQCQEWNTLHERAESGVRGAALTSGINRIDELEYETIARVSSGIPELDRVLGGGVVPGMVVLVGGQPGIGKSTLMMQLAAAKGKGLLYVSSEESRTQLQLRAQRLGCHKSQFHILCSTNLEEIVAHLDSFRPPVVIVDSIQMIQSDTIESARGSTAQVRHCNQECIDWARRHQRALFVVAHVTKEGAIAGPKVIEHAVDAVLYFEDSAENIRYLRTIKNRFGTVDEVGLFRMDEKGLSGIERAEGLFCDSARVQLPPGVATAPIFAGTRLLMIEVQALTIPASGGISRIYSDRIDSRKIARLAAVLERHLGVPLGGHDIFVNVAGGIQIKEVGVELAIAHALYSVQYGRALPIGLSLMGEVSLAGEIRALSQLERRLRVAQEMGYRRGVGPANPSPTLAQGIEWVGCRTLYESIEAVFGAHGARDSRESTRKSAKGTEKSGGATPTETAATPL